MDIEAKVINHISSYKILLVFRKKLKQWNLSPKRISNIVIIAQETNVKKQKDMQIVIRSIFVRLLIKILIKVSAIVLI